MEAAKKARTSATPPIALTIAGSDSSAGAGVQADLKTFSALGVYGLSALTAITAQSTQGVYDVEVLSAGIVRQQIAVLLQDFNIAAAKTGMLGSEEVVEAVIEVSSTLGVPLVVDPVVYSQSGAALISDQGISLVKTKLFAAAALITPNIPEAALLLGWSEERVSENRFDACKTLEELSGCAVLLTGGHSYVGSVEDVLCIEDKIQTFSRPIIETKNTHGTGCTLSAAIAAYLARGVALEKAVELAGDFVHAAISAARNQRLGKGSGPVEHFFAYREPSE